MRTRSEPTNTRVCVSMDKNIVLKTSVASKSVMDLLLKYLSATLFLNIGTERFNLIL